MEYRITADLAPPTGAPPLDALQQRGVAALLAEWLDRVATIEGPDGVEITPFDHEVAAAPAGATVQLLVEAPALAFAENGAEALLQEILERTEHLADWTVGKCEVTVTDAELAQVVAAEDEVAVVTSRGRIPDEVRAEQHRRLLDLGAHLRAFDTSSFTDPAHRDGAGAGRPAPGEDGPGLAAGALVHCAVVLTDELFLDILALEEDVRMSAAGLTAEDYEAMYVLHDMPPRYREHYDAHFAKRFLLASAAVYTRLTVPGWRPPDSTAEALALHLLVEQATDLLLAQAGLGEDLVESMMAAFRRHAFSDLDHEGLYLPAATDGAARAGAGGGGGVPSDADDGAATVAAWFRPRGEAAGHPYLLVD